MELNVAAAPCKIPTPLAKEAGHLVELNVCGTAQTR